MVAFITTGRLQNNECGHLYLISESITLPHHVNNSNLKVHWSLLRIWRASQIHLAERYRPFPQLHMRDLASDLELTDF